MEVEVICRTILAAILAAFMFAGAGAGTASAQEKDGCRATIMESGRRQL
jgi:hypothetical protein